MSLIIQVYDNKGAYTSYEIESKITVIPDLYNLTYIVTNLITASPYFYINKILNEGSYLSSLQELQLISSLLNEQSLRDKYGLVCQDNSTVSFPKTYGPLSNYSGVLAVNLFYSF